MDRNEIESRLGFSDITVRCRCVLKLIESIIAKVPKGGKIASSSVEIPELTFLWEKCGTECSATANFIAEGLVSLVVRHLLDFDHAVNMFLSVIASARNTSAPVQGLLKLLSLQSAEKLDTSHSRNQYSIQKPQHPVITALIRRPDAWSAVLQSISGVLWSNGERSSGIKLIEPVLKYVFLHPSPGNEHCAMKICLCEKLCCIVNDDSSLSRLIDFMLSAIPWLQVQCDTEVAKAVSFILHIKRCVLSKQKLHSEFPLENLLFSLLALCYHSLKYGLDDTELLAAAKDLTEHLAEQDEPSLIINACLMLLSVIIVESTCSTTEKLIHIGRELLAKCAISPTVAGVAFVSVLQIISEPQIICVTPSEKAKMSLMEFQKDLEACCTESGKPLPCRTVGVKHFEAFTASTSNCLYCVYSAFKWDVSSKNEKLTWLNYVKEQISNGCSISPFIFHLVSSFFIFGSEEELQISLEVLEAIALKQPEMSTKLFPLLVYKHINQKDPESQLLILEYLIKTATHKYSVTPVLSILRMMAKHSGLKAQAIYLMVELWKKHDRCLSFLNELLCEKNMDMSMDTGVYEVLIAQAAAIKEICMQKPEQHGAEFLNLLSAILNTATDEASCPAAALALDGVHSLCQSEVIDIRSTWKVLAPRLCKDKRTLISSRTYKLISLIPVLRVQSFEFDRFMNDIVSYLWKQVSLGINSPVTVGAIYKALAKFPTESHTLKLLPAEAKENLKLPATMASTPFEMGKSPEDVLSYTPGYCFIDLLKSIENENILEGYAEFLGSLVEQEVKALPRGIYHQRKTVSQKKTVSEGLAKVPGLLCGQFHANRFPSIQKNLAAGVLLSYEPPIDMGKDGQPLKRSLAEQGRFYPQVLEVMINEVNLEVTEWRRCVLTPSAWGAFMERCFFACEDGRRAELDLQRSHGHLKESAEKITFMMDTAWLWVRDQLMELIKITSRSKSSSLANAVFAVGGLVKALDKFYGCLEDKAKDVAAECHDFTDHKTFQKQCVETIVCAMNPNYKPSSKTKVLSWLLTHLSKPSSNSSYVVQASASASLCNIVSSLTSGDVNQVSYLYEILLQILSSNIAPVMTLYSGIGLGLFTRALCQSGFVECGERQVNTVLSTAERLRSILSTEDDVKTGHVVCLTLVHSALSQNGNPAFFEFIKDVCDEFYEKLMNEDPSSVDFELISICSSCMMISGTSSNSVDLQDVVELMDWFDQKRIETPQCEGTATSLGILVDALQRLGHSNGSDTRARLFKEWAQVAASEKRPTLNRLAALNGLCALFSAGLGLTQINSELSTGNVQAGLNDLVQFMFKLLEAVRDNGLQCVSSWLLGHLFSTHAGQQQDVSVVPSSYSYLSETSIIKPLVNFIADATENGNFQHRKHFVLCLKALAQNFARPLPPLNWIAFLSSPMQKAHGTEIADICLELAMYQMCGSSNAVSLLASYIVPPAVHGLSRKCRLMLLKNTPLLANSLPSAKLQQFFKSVVYPMSKEPQLFELEGIIALQAIMEAFGSASSNKAALGSLHQVVVSMVTNLKSNFTLLSRHLPLVCKSLCHLPAEQLDSLISVADGLEDLPSVMLLCCHLVGMGHRPLSSLRPLIESAKQLSQCEKSKIPAILFHCFADNTSNEGSDVNKSEKCILFLMETVGWVKIASSTRSTFEIMPVEEVVNFLIDICLATIMGCAGFEVSFSFYREDSITHESLMSSLPLALSVLFSRSKWNETVDQILEWLLFLYQSNFLNDEDKYYIKSSFCLIRNTKEFAKSSIWIEIAQ